MSEKAYKRCLITEELVDLCGDFREAGALRQMIYWTPRMYDIDQYIEEEKRRIEGRTKVSKTHGWIKKSGAELADETMIMSRATAQRKLESLSEKGFIERRENQSERLERTYEYRVNICKIEESLQEIGHSLATVASEEYKALQEIAQTSDKVVKNERPVVNDEDSAHAHNAGARTETTTETTYSRRGDAERKRTDWVPTDGKTTASDLPIPDSVHQAKTNMRRLDGNEVNKYLLFIFADFFPVSGRSPFDYIGWLNKIAKQESPEWVADMLYDMRDMDEFDPSGSKDYKRALADRAMKYLQGAASGGIGSPEENTDYDAEEVEAFIENGYDEERFGKINQTTYRYFSE